MTINNEGLLSVRDPVTNATGTTDPSTIPGVYGEFVAQSASGSSENTALFMDVGEDMSFSYETNQDVLDAAGVEEQTDRTQVVQKLFTFFEDPWE